MNTVSVIRLKPRMKAKSKESLVREFLQWDENGRSTPVTADLLAGLYYHSYKQKYRLYPLTDLQEDVRNFQQFLTTHVKEDPSIAPWVVEVFFGLKHFENLKPSSFCNPRVLSGWSAFERAQKLRTQLGGGEQSEFKREFSGQGTIYV